MSYENRYLDDVIAVALIEDNRLVREGVTSLLNRFPDMRVVGTDPCDLSTLNSTDANPHPQVILTAVGMEIGDSLQAAKDIRRDFPGVGLVVMDLLPAHEDVLEFINAGELTAREEEVVTLVVDGLSNKAIGKALHVSIHTVKSHLRNIMEKLTLHSRLQIATYVYQMKDRDSNA